MGCYFLLASPDFGAPNLHIKDEEGETTEHITSRSISKSGNPQRTTSSGLVNYPYQTIQLEADGEWHTYEVLHETIHAKRIQGFRDLGYQIKQDPNRSYEYKRKIRSTLTDDIELAKNKGAWDSSYGLLNSKQALELAGDYSLIAEGHEQIYSADVFSEGVGRKTHSQRKVSKKASGNDWVKVFKNQVLTDWHFGDDGQFTKNECYDSLVDPEDRKDDCDDCEGRFASSPVWPPYRVGDLINVIAMTDVIPQLAGAGGVFDACGPDGIIPLDHCLMDTNFDSRQRVPTTSGHKGKKAKKAKKA